MRSLTITKDLFFLGLVFGGIATLTFGLMRVETIESPESFGANDPARSDVALVATAVDAAFERHWASRDLLHAGRVNNLLVARRISLGIAGTIPSLAEMRQLESQSDEDQIDWWVSRLLADRRASNYLAERLTRSLVGVEDGPFLIFRRRRFVSWLSDQLFSNRPYDELVSEIMTEEGLWTDTPAVNFYTRTIQQGEGNNKPNPVLLAGRTSRAFLGMRIDCLQCHDDFLDSVELGGADDLRSGTQMDFHSLAAFFSDVESSLLGIRDVEEHLPYQYQLLDDDEASVVIPAVPFHAELDGHEANQRRRLANWVTHKDNRPFARAAVNRIWAIMFGRGLINPIDEIPLGGPFPEVLEILTDDFVGHGFNFHRLIRVIGTTNAMRLDSAVDFEVTQRHEDAVAIFPMIRLRPEQVAGAIGQSTCLTTINSGSHIMTRLMKFGQQNEFVNRFGDPGEDEFRDRGETVTQRLLMLNGEMVGERLVNFLNAPSHLARLSPDIDTAVDVIYLTTLTRYPNAEEKRKAASWLNEQGRDQRGEEVIDLYWSLINSAEFRWNH